MLIVMLFDTWRRLLSEKVLFEGRKKLLWILWFCLLQPVIGAKKKKINTRLFRLIKCELTPIASWTVCLWSLRVLIDYSWNFSSLWLAVMITLVLVSRHSKPSEVRTWRRSELQWTSWAFGIHMSSNTKSSRSVFLFLLQFLNMLFCCPFCRLLICSLLKKRPESTKYSRRLPRQWGSEDWWCILISKILTGLVNLYCWQLFSS